MVEKERHQVIVERKRKGFDIVKYKENGTQIVKWYKGKVIAIRNKKKA